MRRALRVLLAAAYFAAGIGHFLFTGALLSITPKWVPQPELVIAATGVCEIAGAIALAQPWSRRLTCAAGIAFALYAVCVFPANINHMMIDMARAHPRLGLAYHIPRLLLQPVLIWLALWTGRVIDWPFARREAGR